MAPPESKQQLPISNRNNTKKKVLAILLPALLAVAIGFFLQSEHGDGLLPGASWAMQVHKTRHVSYPGHTLAHELRTIACTGAARVSGDIDWLGPESF